MEEEEEEIILGQDVVLREKAALKKLLSALPLKAQLGFSSLKEKYYNRNDSSLKEVIKAAKQGDGLKVEYTCINVSKQSVVLGCNLGIVFFYDRCTGCLSRFICDNKHAPIVSIQLLETRQFIATGQFTGTITIFQYGNDKSNGAMKALLKCTVDSHHKAPVTSVLWTPDGTKLFTADSEGNVAITVINMDEGKTHTVFICNEDSPVTQLSFSHTALLISTLKRTLIWPFNTKKIVQVGMQERKSFGNFGACFYPPAGPHPTADNITDVYAARPGLRLWKATIDGKVLSTMIFKDSIYKGEPIIETLDLPSNINFPTQADMKQFGPLVVFNEKFIVTWKGSCVWVLDPITGYIIGAHSNLGCVIDVSVTENELFVLSKGEEHFIRRILFEVRIPCIVVEELDLNNPEEISKAQRGSSVSQFEDQDRIDKLIDGVGSKMLYAFKDVKSKVKEMKEQIRSRDNSDDHNSDQVMSPSFLHRRVNNEQQELSSAGDLTSEENDTSTENEKSMELFDKPFESSSEAYIEDKQISNDSPSQVALVVAERSPPVFDHLSKEDFPTDIVFQGTSANIAKKKKKKTKRKMKIKTSSEVNDDDDDVGHNAAIKHGNDIRCNDAVTHGNDVRSNDQDDDTLTLCNYVGGIIEGDNTLTNGDNKSTTNGDIDINVDAELSSIVTTPLIISKNVDTPGKETLNNTNIINGLLMHEDKDTNDLLIKNGSPEFYFSLENKNSSASNIENKVTPDKDIPSCEISVNTDFKSDLKEGNSLAPDAKIDSTFADSQTENANTDICAIKCDKMDNSIDNANVNITNHSTDDPKLKNIEKSENNILDSIPNTISLDQNYKNEINEIKENNKYAPLEKQSLVVIDTQPSVTMDTQPSFNIEADSLNLDLQTLHDNSTVEENLTLDNRVESLNEASTPKDLNEISPLPSEFPILTLEATENIPKENVVLPNSEHSQDGSKEFSYKDLNMSSQFDDDITKNNSLMKIALDNSILNDSSVVHVKISHQRQGSNAHVKISHQRQGSNASVQSLGMSERCKEVRGEAEEVSDMKPPLGVMLGIDDTIESNVQQVKEEYRSINDNLTIDTNLDDSLFEEGKLYPVSPFPAPQMASIYSQRNLSLTDYSLSIHDESIEEGTGDEVVNDYDYDKIDVNQDLIESMESITDVEDNIFGEESPHPIKSKSAIRSKRKSKDRFSLPSSPCSSDMEGRPLANARDKEESVQERLRYLADSWAEVNLPNTSLIQHIACSATAVWALDNQDHIFYSLANSQSSQAYTWKKCDGRATHIATNQDGSVVWCIDRHKVSYYRTGIKEGQPQGGSWEPFEKDMHYVSVDKDNVWAIKTNGDVFVRTGISSQKPSGSGWITIKAASDLVQITSLNGIIWALDIYNHVQIFQGELENIDPEDADILSNWIELPGITATHVMLGAKAVCWIIDSDNGVWFNQDICRENPLGGTWYQLSLGEHQSQDATWFSSILSYFTKGNEPKMIVANEITGVLMLGKLGTVHVAHGHLLGTRWELTTPSQLKDSTCWSCIAAGGADMNRGYTWALQPNGQLYCFKANGAQSYSIHPPNRVVLKYCSAGPRSLWALTASQDVFIRLGISDTSPQGLKWLKVDMLSQKNRRLIHICNGNLVVWAVDFEGNVWFQMGREEMRGSGFAPAWVSVEGCPLDGSKFTKVVVGPDDHIVWACDDKNNVYARKDITESFWVGTSWEIVSGSSAKDLVVSHNHVWALCPDGDVICRFGVSKSNVIGDYWKKVPGNFEQISVSANDDLWGIDRQGHLYERQTLLFYGSTLSNRAPSYNDLFSDHNDWEFI